MKKLSIGISSIIALIALWGAFLLPTAFAQTSPSSGDFVFADQGQLGSTTSYDNLDHQYEVRIGTGWTGTTTGVVIAISTTQLSAPNSFARFDILGWSNSSYSSSVSDCGYDGELNATGVYSATSSTPFYELNNQLFSGSACTFNPNLYYSIQYVVDGYDSDTGPISIAGIANWIPPSGWQVGNFGGSVNNYPPFFPMFAIVGGGFQITPTASSSGILLSNTNIFCNNTFGSSTPGISTDIGISMCNVLTYLFVPNNAQLQSMLNLQGLMLSKVPFSYYGQIYSEISGLVASSSTGNIPEYSINFDQIDFSSSTDLGYILPRGNFDLLSSTTINTYIPAGIHDTLYSLAEFAIWVSVVLYIYDSLVRRPRWDRNGHAV